MPNKTPRGGGRGVPEGLGLARNMDFHITNFHLIWKCITLAYDMHFYIKIWISISQKNLKKLLPKNVKNIP